MATRINETLWGASNTYVWANGNSGSQNAKVPIVSYGDLIYNHQSDLLNKPYDNSVSVWGMPADCSAATVTTCSWWNDSGTLAKEIIAPNTLVYMPISLIITAVTGDNLPQTVATQNQYSETNNYMHRTAYNTTAISLSGTFTNPSSTNVSYSHGLRTSCQNTSSNTRNYYLNQQVLYYDYRKCLYLPCCSIMPTKKVPKSDAIISSRLEDIDARVATAKTNYNITNDDFVLVGISFRSYSGLKLTSGDSDRIYSPLNTPYPVGINIRNKPSTRSRALFYSSDSEEASFLSPAAMTKYIGLGCDPNMQLQAIPFPAASSLPTATRFFDNKNVVYDLGTDKARSCDNMFKISEKKWTFSDVAYHWAFGLSYGTDNILHNIDDIDLSSFTSADIYGISLVPYVVIDDDKSAGNIEAIKRVIMHELAFLGFPLVKTSSYAATAKWDSDEENIYIPLFDSNMITTGNYTTLKQAFIDNLPQTNWQDIFSNSYIINHYDPGYQPHPDPDPDADTGDLNNQQLHNLRYRGSNNYYLLNESTLSQFIGFINGLYTGESDPDKKRSIDFMGSNPTDYIVGIYGCGIELFGGATTSIKLGAVDTADAGIYGQAVPTNLTYVNFGDYDIPAYGNFLDFKPYTTIEVYVPLCGTIEVDPGEYIGHNLKVDGLIDYQTGELTARIVRDGKTVTNTLSGSMWVQLPVTAAKMGDYQNNQHQLRMQLLSSVLSFGQSSANAINSDVQSAAGAIAGSAAGGSPTALATPGKAQFTIPQNAASTALSLYNTHYQITHTQPARATASSASSGNALEMYNHAMIFIKRPTFLQGYDQAAYAHTIGHACCISAPLSSFSGYTVFSAADLDNIHTKRAADPLQATAQEKQLLKQALQAGIYINTISPE